MIVDHALGFAQTTHLSEGWMQAVRMTGTRFAMPAFMICSGMLLAARSVTRRRWSEVAAAALVVNLGAAVTGMASFVPDILALWCLAIAFQRPMRRWPTLIVVIGLLQAVHWQVPVGGYQPGWVVAFIGIGVLASRGDLDGLFERAARTAPAQVAAMGRHPLAWYVGHLLVFGAITLLGKQLTWW